MRIAVVVPTHRRSDHLGVCLGALLAQERLPEEVLAVVRPDDAASRGVIGRFPAPVREVLVHEHGLLAALTAGARASTASIVAFTDDDAEPGPAWVRQLLEAFDDDPAVGGVGGRDLIAGEEGDPGLVVGRVSRWGKLVGNHSRGAGAARSVDVLKGVNMSYRREVLALPVGYRGTSTQAHTEVAMGLWARAHGWTLRYDPAIAVVHHEAARHASIGRERWKADAASQTAHNLVAGMLAAQPERFWPRAVYGLAVGDRGTPGVAQALASLAQRRPWEANALLPSLKGQLDALVAARRGRGVRLRPLLELDAERSA